MTSTGDSSFLQTRIPYSQRECVSVFVMCVCLKVHHSIQEKARRLAYSSQTAECRTNLTMSSRPRVRVTTVVVVAVVIVATHSLVSLSS